MHRLLALATICAACGDGAPPLDDPGALVEVTMEGRAGVLLDEIPESQRELVVADLLSQPADAWERRARRQVSTALYRLVYRNFYGDDLGQLPLPPATQWEIDVQAPERAIIDGHDLVVASYAFRGTLLTGVEQPGLSDARLAAIGGVVEEPFVLPADPEHLLERTGYACMDEADFPPNSVDTENAPAFFDDLCEAGADDGCHVTAPIPEVSCVEALESGVGRVEVTFRFERLPWDPARADAVRLGEPVRGGASLRAVEEGVEDHRVIYRYFPEDSCAIAEGCVGAAGWRRLLQFTATMHNIGDEPSELGDVGPESPVFQNNMVSFSECHGHMHFNHYGRFELGSDAGEGSKRAFCLESTSRYFNNETTPLVHPYSCEYQGTEAGWGDDYIAGLDCQWIDITGAPAGKDTLSFVVNPDEFLCEGAVVRDETGAPLFEETAFVNEQGLTESRFQCDRFAGAADDNVATTDVEIPPQGGTFVSAPCTRGQLGPLRNCGFALAGDVIACAPGETVTLTCGGAGETAGAALRVCESSHLLGEMACTFRDALATAVQAGADAEVTFTCPQARSAAEQGGLAHVFVAPLVDGDDVSMVSCAVAP